MAGWIILGVLVIIVFLLIGMYNSLVQLRVRADSAWSDIDVQLKRRHDLIPNLVETVKGYATHEKGTFEEYRQVSLAGDAGHWPRGQGRCGKSADRSAEEPVRSGGKLSPVEGLRRIHSASRVAQSTEDIIQNARRYYNAVVRDLNTKIQSFPTNILAGMFGFRSANSLRPLPRIANPSR